MAIDLTQIAQSTIGMSIYNTIVTCARPISPETIAARLQSIHFRDLELADIADPILFMLDKGWLKVAGEGRLDVVDSKRRQVKYRGRNDFHVNEDGIVEGGWSDWMVSCPGCTPKFLANIVEEMAV